MKIIYIFFIFNILFLNLLSAQITDSLASEIARKIWKCLERPDPCPSVFFGDDEAMATYSYEDHRIRLSKKLVKESFVLKFGKDAAAALAIVIGHEIYHATKGSKQLQRFGCWGTNDTLKGIELNADLYGLIWAYFTGYQQAGEVFDDIFPTGVGCYPGKKERMESDNTLKKKAEKYFQVFELGNLLLISADTDEDYEYARQCYQYIQSQTLISTQAVEYSLGLSWFLQALAGRAAEPFVFPLEFSGFSALKRLGGSKFSSEDINDKLSKAVYHFSRATASANTLNTQRGDDYLNGRIGLCSALMLKDIDSADDNIDELEREFPEKAAIKLLRAVFWALRNQGEDLERSKSLLQTLANAPGEMPHVQQMARFNLTVLNEPEARDVKKEAAPCPEFINTSGTLSSVVDSLGNRANGIMLPTNTLVNIKHLKSGTVYLIEKWLGQPGINRTQRAFRKPDRCNCVPAPNASSGLNFQGQYLFWRHPDAKTGIVYTLDSNKRVVPLCIQVFRP